MISHRFIGRKISPIEIRSANVELSEAVEKWHMRDLARERVKYIFIDGVTLCMYIKRDIEIVPVLVAIGITEAGHRLVLQSGDKESISRWRS